ncbi:MAG: FAD-dependent oxidoreductase, partial [Alphaproteobacteria bacterium]|nr:FAD-dependent oxidoreductase [Alphaproteobacteria bacterium]
MADKKFDLVVVGGGPGGYVAAIRAAQLGMKAAVIEANHLGGICLNWGCIPTKALLRTSEIYHYMTHAEDYGLKADKVSFDIKKVVERSRGVAKQLNQGVGYLLKKNKVEVIDGWAKLAGGKEGARKLTVEKDGKSVADVTAKHVILATGARARDLPGLEADGKQVWTYKEAMTPDGFPKSL